MNDNCVMLTHDKNVSNHPGSKKISRNESIIQFVCYRQEMFDYHFGLFVLYLIHVLRRISLHISQTFDTNMKKNI